MPVIGCLLAFNATWLIFPRVKALLDIALFGTDVATDWINGYNLIIDEHIFWGTVMCLLPLITPAIVGPIAIFERSGNRRWYKILPFLILYIPFVLIATPVYIGFVLFTGILKLWDPELAKNGALCGMDGDKFVNASSIFRITEIATESCPQAMLGIYIQLILGPANDPKARAIQFLGLAASMASLVKGCADWWVRQSRSWVRGENEPTLLETAQASLYFIPHVLFRTTATTFCAAFMGYYFLVPISLVLVIVIPIFFFLLKRTKSETGDLIYNLIVSLIAPTVFESTNKPGRTLMKRNITITTSILLSDPHPGFHPG